MRTLPTRRVDAVPFTRRLQTRLEGADQAGREIINRRLTLGLHEIRSPGCPGALNRLWDDLAKQLSEALIRHCPRIPATPLYLIYRETADPLLKRPAFFLNLLFDKIYQHYGAHSAALALCRILTESEYRESGNEMAKEVLASLSDTTQAILLKEIFIHNFTLGISVFRGIYFPPDSSDVTPIHRTREPVGIEQAVRVLNAITASDRAAGKLVAKIILQLDPELASAIIDDDKLYQREMLLYLMIRQNPRQTVQSIDLLVEKDLAEAIALIEPAARSHPRSAGRLLRESSKKQEILLEAWAWVAPEANRFLTPPLRHQARIQASAARLDTILIRNKVDEIKPLCLWLGELRKGSVGRREEQIMLRVLAAAITSFPNGGDRVAGLLVAFIRDASSPPTITGEVVAFTEKLAGKIDRLLARGRLKSE